MLAWIIKEGATLGSIKHANQCQCHQMLIAAVLLTCNCLFCVCSGGSLWNERQAANDGSSFPYGNPSLLFISSLIVIIETFTRALAILLTPVHPSMMNAL